MTPRRPSQINMGSGINIALALVLLGAALRLWDKLADMQMAQADARGDIKVLAQQIATLKDDVAEVRDQLKGIIEDAKEK